MNKINFDNAATSPVCKSFLDNIQEYANRYYNPSSINEKSQELKKEIEECREKIANLINCDPEEIIFTSGSSESNSLAIDGFIKANDRDYYRVISSNIEHPSIMNNPNVYEFIECDNQGLFRPEQFEKYRNTLFCIGLANNEIGAIPPIERISEVIHKNDNYLFVDATQAVGKVNIDVKNMKIDMLSASGHKIGALKGIGFLYVNKDVNINPIIYGTQENGLRGGTYNYLGIKSLSCAIDEIDISKQIKIINLRNYMMNELLKIYSGITINGHIPYRLPNNLNICIHNININSQQLVSLLDIHGFIVSAGSACSSGINKPSHVLKAIGLSDDEINHSIRITLSEENTKEEIDKFVECLKNIIKMYKI